MPDSIISRLLRGFYLGRWKQAFAVTTQSIATTHPCFYSENNTAIAVTRHPNLHSPSKDFTYSIGFGILSKHTMQSYNQNESDDEITTEQLFAMELNKLHLEEFSESWFHLERPADIEAYTQFVNQRSPYE